MALAACSTGSTSLSSDSTLSPSVSSTIVAAAATTTTLVSTTLAPATTVLPTTTVATPTTLAVATTVAATSLPETTLPTAAETTVPVTTPPTTLVETTVTPPPVTTPPTPGCIACQSSYVFPYESYFAVPQLGTEPVRGTGCGGDGSLGPKIPDGIWNGFIKISATTLTIDVQCIYYGASAAPYVAACEAENSADDCLEFGDDFWMVNNNKRTRTVDLDPGFRRRYAYPNCKDPGPGHGSAPESEGEDQFDSWLIIENGRATFALTSCVYG